MAGRACARSFVAMNLLPKLGLALVASYVIGAVLAVAGDVGTFTAALGNGTKLSAPSFIIVIETLASLALLRGRRAGVYPLLALTTVSCAAILFDGDFNNAVLSTGQVAWQVVEVVLTFAVWALA